MSRLVSFLSLAVTLTLLAVALAAFGGPGGEGVGAVFLAGGLVTGGFTVVNILIRIRRRR